MAQSAPPAIDYQLSTIVEGDFMRRASVIACATGMAALLTACQRTPPSGPPTDAEAQQIDQRVQDYFRKSANLPDKITLKVIDLAPAAAPGLLTANLEASNGTNTQKVPLVLSRDGRFLIQGQLTDLSIDPFQANMEKIALKDVPMRGNPNASVTIVEYSDFQCPFCGRAYHTVEEQVLKEYGDRVRLVYKNFPLAIHPWAENAALASACARQQSPQAFWKMYDYLFQNQKDITADNLKEKAQAVEGIDASAFAACFDNKALLDAVKAEQQEGTALGIRSTPTFFVNGRKLEGAVPFDNFKTAIDQALAASGDKGPPPPEPAKPG
jgi:protein-disulfide isomerase